MILTGFDQDKLTLCACFHFNKVMHLHFMKNSLLESSLYVIRYLTAEKDQESFKFACKLSIIYFPFVYVFLLELWQHGE